MHAATLTITPDKSVYDVGEQIRLVVFGDPMGQATSEIQGFIRFDPDLAAYVSSTQTALTSFGGLISWPLGPLSGGPGFAEAFSQISGAAPLVADCCLMASILLTASAPGALEIDWDTTSQDGLRFFDIVEATGTSVTIVPEPSASLLLALGLFAITARLRHGRRRATATTATATSTRAT